MSLTYRDVEMMDRAFGGLSDTLLKNRMMAEQKAERKQSAATSAMERGQDVDFRERELRQRIKAQDEAAKDRDAALGIRQENADTSKAKGSKVFYFVSPTTKNVMSFTGTAADAQAQLEKIQAAKPTEGLVMTDKEPDGLKDLNEIPIDDQLTLHASDADALKYYTQKMAAKAKVDAAGAKSASGAGGTAYDITKVDHLPNKSFIPAAGISATNQPTMSVTNTVSRRPVEVNAARPPLAPGLPNLAPPVLPNANSRQDTPGRMDKLTPTPADVSYLTAHPDMKAKFEARFGVGSADQYLP